MERTRLGKIKYLIYWYFNVYFWDYIRWFYKFIINIIKYIFHRTAYIICLPWQWICHWFVLGKFESWHYTYWEDPEEVGYDKIENIRTCESVCERKYCPYKCRFINH